MTKARVAVTNEVVLGRVTAETYDRFARFLRARGWDSLDSLLNAGLEGENFLDAGSGPGYIGLEWLKRRGGNARLAGLDISPAMIALARRNAAECGLEDRTEYVVGDAMDMPFPDGCFDAVLSNGSIHEWEDPTRGLREIMRVLRPGGRFWVFDVRRDANPLIKWLIYAIIRPKEIRSGFLASFNASYTLGEMADILDRAGLHGCGLRREFFGLSIVGSKPGLGSF